MATSDNNGRQPLPPAVRRRLQACFEHATKSASGGDFKYATEMFMQCVTGDPSNPIYVTQFLNNLGKFYKDNKTGAGFTSKPKATPSTLVIIRPSISMRSASLPESYRNCSARSYSVDCCQRGSRKAGKS